MVGMIASIRNGVTTIFDHHASPGGDGQLFRIADAARQTGVRGCLCYEVSDRDGAEVAQQGMRKIVRFFEHCKTRGEDRLRGLFGMHASFTLSDETLDDADRSRRISTRDFTYTPRKRHRTRRAAGASTG